MIWSFLISESFWTAATMQPLTSVQQARCLPSTSSRFDFISLWDEIILYAVLISSSPVTSHSIYLMTRNLNYGFAGAVLNTSSGQDMQCPFQEPGTEHIGRLTWHITMLWLWCNAWSCTFCLLLPVRDLVVAQELLHAAEGAQSSPCRYQWCRFEG